MDELRSRFANAFEEIEKYLRRSCAEAELAPFARALGLAAKTVSAVRHYAQDLREFASLRGTLVRGPHGEEPGAAPDLHVVERIESVKTRLFSPPAIGDLFHTTVATCNFDSPLSLAANRMMHSNYSQLPVYSESALEGVLTTEMIGRWFGHCLAKEAAPAPETNVGVVLQLAEDRENYDLLSPTDNVFDALERFRGFQKRGKRLDAILITANASKKHRPMGIISACDVPRLYEAIR